MRKKVQIRVEAVAALLLLIVLASLTMLLIVSTGKTYRRLVGSGEASRQVRTALAFISTKIRQADGVVSVRASPFGGNAVVISQTVENQVYEDWIFYDGSMLREAVVPAGSVLVPSAFERIAALDTVQITQTGRQIRVEAAVRAGSKDGAAGSIELTLRG